MVVEQVKEGRRRGKVEKECHHAGRPSLRGGRFSANLCHADTQSDDGEIGD